MASSAGHVASEPRPASIASKAVVAQRAIAPKVDASTGALLTPSLESILHAFRLDGQHDKELLLELVRAKRAEDQRLKAADLKYAEQYRAASLALYEKMFHLHQAAQCHPGLMSTAYPSPTSTVSDHEAAFGVASGSRLPGQSPEPLSPLDLAGEMASRKRSFGFDSAAVPAPKRSKHEIAMAALRAKCERNLAAKSTNTASTSAPIKRPRTSASSACASTSSSQSPSPALSVSAPIEPSGVASAAANARRLSAAQLAKTRTSSHSPPPPSSRLSSPITASLSSSSSLPTSKRSDSPVIEPRTSGSPAPIMTTITTAVTSSRSVSPVERRDAAKSTIASLLNGSTVSARSFQTAMSDVRSAPATVSV